MGDRVVGLVPARPVDPRTVAGLSLRCRGVDGVRRGRRLPQTDARVLPPGRAEVGFSTPARSLARRGWILDGAQARRDHREISFPGSREARSRSSAARLYNSLRTFTIHCPRVGHGSSCGRRFPAAILGPAAVVAVFLYVFWGCARSRPRSCATHGAGADRALCVAARNVFAAPGCPLVPACLLMSRCWRGAQWDRGAGESRSCV